MQWNAKSAANAALVIMSVLFMVSAGISSWRGQMDQQRRENARPAQIFLEQQAYLESLAELPPQTWQASIASRD
jgi:hypothetical protein